MSGWKDDEDVEAEEDEDLANDPIAQIDVQVSIFPAADPSGIFRVGPRTNGRFPPQQQRILSTVRQAYQQDMNGIHAVMGDLTDVERAILQRALTL